MSKMSHNMMKTFDPTNNMETQPTTERQKIMAKRISTINNVDAFPDVTFLVGLKPIEITAHKIFLATASEVFEAMFQKEVETKGNVKIEVADVEKESFLQVLHYCYTLEVTQSSFTEDNMLDILYAADKFELPEMLEQIVGYVVERITANNCLEVFNITHLMGSDEIKEKCLNIIQEDPFRFFEDTCFLDLSLSAVQMLVLRLSTMNCTGADLKRAVLSWLVEHAYCNPEETTDDEVLLQNGFRAEDFGNKPYHSVTREGPDLMMFEEFKSNTTRIQLLKDRWLFGVGLCLGVRGGPKDETVKLTILQNEEEIYSVERQVKQPDCFSIVDIMFKKTKVPKGMVYLTVEFPSKEQRCVTTHSICGKKMHYIDDKGYYHDDYNCSWKCVKMIAGDCMPQMPFSCLSHLNFAAS